MLIDIYIFLSSIFNYLSKIIQIFDLVKKKTNFSLKVLKTKFNLFYYCYIIIFLLLLI